MVPGVKRMEKINEGYVRFLSVALSSDAIAMDNGIKNMCESEIISVFQGTMDYSKISLLSKYVLGNSEINNEIKNDIVSNIWDNTEYDIVLSELEWDVICSVPSSEKFNIPSDKVSMYDYSLEDLEYMYQDNEFAKDVYDKICVCRSLKSVKEKEMVMRKAY